ncbi:hypothetical protein OE88DRAFT_1651512 [Heliocybe sulcata]|uniref:Uncharacterized protein n=1 Tax=Heliocybe sulcata TaxID=5364 RepID=A0A5C3NN95_9AGAM|nr:hypothetical protein OE88DRAFT_1651512 [Heliocybe sulcata]
MTLQVINFHPERVMAHPRVLKWYRSVLDTDDSDHDSAEDLFDEMDNDEAIAAYYQATRS